MVIDINTIDWNLAWRNAREKKRSGDGPKGASFWNGRARDFADNPQRNNDYENRILELLNPDPSWTVLDVGCGPGTLAIPLAGCVSSVTAMDFSETMLEILGEKAERRGIRNITPCHADMEGDWNRFPFGGHDAVIASRSLIARDLKGMLETLSRFARKKVLVAAMTRQAPLDVRIFNATGRCHQPGPDFIYIINLLHRMGVYPRLDYAVQEVRRIYDSPEKAVEDSRWMIDGMTPEEETRLLGFFRENLTRVDGAWALPGTRMVRWAVIQWDVG